MASINPIPYTLDMYRNPSSNKQSKIVFNARKTLRIKRLTLVKITAEKTEKGYKHRKTFGFTWGESPNLCNKVIGVKDQTYYFDEIKFKILPENERAEVYNFSSIRKLYEELLNLI